ncbi:hypothetical protein R1flu_028280 [Riccia fluitans]|uniref:mannan endo-1,4-beta-mannosidase n=1 Tax=Riccia fluitans TaxID=41844 RepID=A0ABD1XL88_9MARC
MDSTPPNSRRHLLSSSIILLLLIDWKQPTLTRATGIKGGFIRRKGIRLEDEDGKPFLVHGCNFYWLMYQAADESSRIMVDDVLRDSKSLGLNVGRTWAFNDGADRALQISPGIYGEKAFQGLDYAIAQAGKHGIRLVLSLINNFDAYGGRPQYVKWARDAGNYLPSNDSFFTHYVTRALKILTRVNSITGIAYKDDPTIMAWELMNEPRCVSDPSGDTLMEWVKEMGAWVKSIDNKHLLQVGMEGFYGSSTPGRRWANPNDIDGLGTDFIRMNQITHIDFATVHCYPDLWLPKLSESRQLSFLQIWVNIHIEDAEDFLDKPVLFTEFGKSDRSLDYKPSQRSDFFWTVYDSVFSSANSGGAAGGAMLWQLLPQGMDQWRDGFAVLANQSSSANVISWQSQRMKRVATNLFHSRSTPVTQLTSHV